MKLKKNVLILGGNSVNNIIWINKMKLKYNANYNVDILEYDNWKVNGFINIEKELEKLRNLIDKNKKYIIIAKSVGIAIAINAIQRKIINTDIVVFMGLPLEFFEMMQINIYSNYQQIKNKIKCLFIQQENDCQCSVEKLKKIFTDNLIISIRGKNHLYNDINKIKKYVDVFIKLNCETTTFHSVKAIDIYDAIKIIDENRVKYKYFNNWLSNSSNKILSFKYKEKKYIAKRTTMDKANTEINNAKMLQKILKNFKSNNYHYEIHCPIVISLKKEYCYLVSEFYGNDLNQSYYNNTYINDKKFNRIINETILYLFDKEINYNGFLPRNVILKDNKIILIDFEDINKKSDIAVETTIKIGWSYFFKIAERKLLNKLTFEDEFSKNIQALNIEKYNNPYLIALIAESYNLDNYKIDDAINVLSPYIDLDTEIAFDIMLFEVNVGNIDKIIKAKIFSLAQIICITEFVETKNQIQKRIDEEVRKIFELSKLTNKSEDFKKYINYIIKSKENSIKFN